MAKKSLEDLAKDVLSSQEGLKSLEDLESLFAPDTTAVTATQQLTAAPVSAQNASAPPVIPAQPPAAPGPEQPISLESIPEKFRDKDLNSSLSKWEKSYAELERELKKQKDDVANLNNLVKTLSDKAKIPEPIATTPPIPAPVQQLPEDDVEDSMFFDKPKEASTKVAARVAAAAIIQYHTAMERQKFVDNFKAQHPDFENYREDMFAILKTRPDLDQNPANLPMVFEMAKQRYAKRLEDMKTAMGIPSPSPAPASTPAPAITEEQMEIIEQRMMEKAKAALLEEAKKRRAAQGTLGGSTTTPAEKATPTQTVKPKTEDEVIFDEILASGPKAANFLKE
jgi:hypothetical protein